MFGIVHNVPATAQHDSQLPAKREMVWIDQPPTWLGLFPMCMAL
jgi:hypothetical protein